MASNAASVYAQKSGVGSSQQGYNPYGNQGSTPDYNSNGYAPPGALAPGGSLYNQYMSSLPQLNNIDVRNYNRMNDDTKSFLGSAYQGAGYSQNDVNNAATKGATPFQAPAAGGVM